MKSYSALDIAMVVINYCNNKSYPISNLKLQKILYYIQAAFLVEKDRVCFEEDIINWSYGPVVEEVYKEYRDYGPIVIPYQEKYVTVKYDSKQNRILLLERRYDDIKLDQSENDLIEKITKIYVNKNPFDLVEKTHKEDPWKNSKQNEKISNDIIKKYYKKYKNELYDNMEC